MDTAGPGPSVEAALRIVEATPAVLAALLAAVPTAWLEAPADGPWGAAEVVAHLADVEQVAFVERIRRIVEEAHPFIASIDPSARLAESEQRSLDDVLAQLAQRRRADVAWARAFSSEDLDRTGTHDVAGTISARQLVHYWATHDLVHLAQLMTAVRAHLEPEIGSMEVFLEEEG